MMTEAKENKCFSQNLSVFTNDFHAEVAVYSGGNQLITCTVCQDCLVDIRKKARS